MKYKKRKNGFKKFVSRLHLWLGLTSGLIVFIVAVTGCIFVFHDEIKDAVQPWRKVEVLQKPYVLPSVITGNLKDDFPGVVSDMIVYQGRDRPAVAHSLKDGVPYNFYFNPYTGAYITKQNLNRDFFLIVEEIHMYLLLPETIGKQVVGISTLIFILMLISGIILWWPKKSKHLQNAFKIKWKAKWRRVNYDWHKTTGLYISVIALLMALTGLSFVYEWVHQGMYQVGNLGKQYPQDLQYPVIDTTGMEVKHVHPIDIAMASTLRLSPQDQMYFVWDQGDKESIVTGAYPTSLHFDHQSNFYYHPLSGELLKKHFYKDKSPGMKLQEMNYGLHTGQFFGIPGKIIAFIASLFVAALPVSGVVIWWGRRNKRTNTRRQQMS